MSKDVDELCSIIRTAVSEAYAFRAEFATECDFKYELFHRLASKVYSGTELGTKIDPTPTCRLHAEAKPMCGHASKADLLICSPSERMTFNYRPEVVIELKKSLNAADVRPLNVTSSDAPISAAMTDDNGTGE